jgi:hypothetical protein
MSAERDVNRIVRSWIRAEEHESADRVLQIVLSRLDTTPQRRHMWSPRRFAFVNKLAPAAIAAVAVVAVAFVGINLWPGSRTGSGGPPPPASPSPSPSHSPSPSPEPTASLVTHVVRPRADGSGDQDPRAASITFTFDAPASWQRFEEQGVWIDHNAPPDGAALFIYGVADVDLFSDPCRPDPRGEADIAVGPTVDDFVTALVDHPSLEVSSPVDVTLAGYSGTYLDLLIPDDISQCATYHAMDAHIYAQGPGHRWHMWVLDVGGVRVLVETNDYAGTSAQRRAELQSIVDSIQITP